MNRKFLFSTLVGIVISGAAAAQSPVTIRFDNSGEEAGITTAGTSEFSFMGSNWSGGTVASVGVPALYASGAFSYQIDSGNAMVVFDQPVEAIEFFYVHGSGLPSGVATALNADGIELASVSSNEATSFAAPANFVSFETTEPVSAIEFSGGVIDNFSFTESDQFVVDFRGVVGQWVAADPQFAEAGEGITLDVIGFANLLFAAWFTYTNFPEPPGDAPATDVGSPDNRWMTAQMEISGNQASGPLLVSAGGQFDAPGTEFQRTEPVGTMSIEFTACNRGIVRYTIDQPPLTREFEIMPLVELVGGVDPDCLEAETGSAR